MIRISLMEVILCLGAAGSLVNCGQTVKADPKSEAPPAAEVETAGDPNVVKVDHAERFPLATASPYSATDDLNVTGTVNPDVSRNVPVISLASGRVLEVHAKLGDTVTKGELLMRVQSSDISGAFRITAKPSRMKLLRGAIDPRQDSS